MESELDMENPSSHENDQQAETSFLKITVRLDNGKDFSDILKRSQAAAGALPFNCLSNFMGCMPGIRV